LFLAGTCVSAQEILWQAVGQRDAIGLYSPVRFIGDVDGDGYDDLVNIGQLPQRYGVIRVLSGRMGTILRTRLPPLANYSYLRLERAGDWNGDGVGDYAATRWTSVWPIDQTVVEILSAAEPQPTRREGGRSAARPRVVSRKT